MKLKAIAQRGSKKDFYDVYFLLELMPIETMLILFQKKFKMHETFHIIKSLAYFDDAEQSVEPFLFDNSITWQQVKSKIRETVKLIG